MFAFAQMIVWWPYWKLQYGYCKVEMSRSDIQDRISARSKQKMWIGYRQQAYSSLNFRFAVSAKYHGIGNTDTYEHCHRAVRVAPVGSML